MSRVAHSFGTITKLLLYLEVISFSHCLNVKVLCEDTGCVWVCFLSSRPNWGPTTVNNDSRG